MNLIFKIAIGVALGIFIVLGIWNAFIYLVIVPAENFSLEFQKDSQEIVIHQERIDELTRLSESDYLPQCDDKLLTAQDGVPRADPTGAIEAFCLMREHAKYNNELLPLLQEQIERIDQYELKYGD